MAEGATTLGLYGTLGVPDSLASNTATIYEIGEDQVAQNLQLLLTAHNAQASQLIDNFVMRTTLQQMRYGSTFQMDMDELDEHGTPDAQKGLTGSLCGFPLRKYGRSLQWTRDYFLEMTGLEFNMQITALLDADIFNVIRQVKKALFRPTNYQFVDELVRSVSAFPLSVKALANADGSPLPTGPNGEYFDPNVHTHYMGASVAGTLSEADMTSLGTTVLEHFRSGQLVFYINKAQENTVRGFTGFQPLVDDQIVMGANLTYARGGLDTVAVYDRRIGRFMGADVWVKYWEPASYVMAFMTGQEKVLAWRMHERKPSDFTLFFDNELFPLRANGFGRYFGLGTYNRVGAAILDVAHTTYQAPPII